MTPGWLVRPPPLSLAPHYCTAPTMGNRKTSMPSIARKLCHPPGMHISNTQPRTAPADARRLRYRQRKFRTVAQNGGAGTDGARHRQGVIAGGCPGV